MLGSKYYGVYLGRFAPFHKGHQMITDGMIATCGIEHSLVMIGSSNVYNERTPFTFEQRKDMIQTLYPKLEIMPFPDINPNLIHFHDSTNQIWLENLKKVEEERKAKFTFFGGSDEDLRVLAEAFETQLLVDRSTVGLDISATKIREALEKEDLKTLEMLLHPKVVPLAQAGYKEFMQSSTYSASK